MKLVVYSGYRAVVPSKRLLDAAKCTGVVDSVQGKAKCIFCIHSSSVIESDGEWQVELAQDGAQLRLCKS